MKYREEEKNTLVSEITLAKMFGMQSLSILGWTSSNTLLKPKRH